MLIAFQVLVLLIAVVIHEYAHLRAMVRADLMVQEMQIGVLIPGLRPLWTTRVPGYPGIPLVIGHIPLWALVRLKPESLKKIQSLPYGDTAPIYGAGIWANLLMLFIALLPIIPFVFPLTTFTVLIFLCFLMIAISLLYFRDTICRYILPIVILFSVVAFSFFATTVFSGLAQAGVGAIPPTVTFGSILYLFFGTIAKISFILVVLNALPVMPLDGGQMIAGFLRQHRPSAEEPFIRFSFVLFLLFVLPILLLPMCV